MKTLTAVAISAVLALAGNAHAQGSAQAQINELKQQVQQLRADIEILKTHMGVVVQAVQSLQQSVQQREAQASRPVAPPPQQQAQGPVSVNVSDAPVLGRADSPVTVVEFSDFECPFCQRFFDTALPELKRDYVDSGKVRYVFVDFPLEDLHPRARKAAEAAHCAADQGKFWEMHDALFTGRGALAPEQLGQYARTLGLDAVAFDSCLASGSKSVQINRGLARGAAIGIRGTPSFLIAKTTAGDVVSGTVTVGAQPVGVFRRAIDQLLGTVK